MFKNEHSVDHYVPSDVAYDTNNEPERQNTAVIPEKKYFTIE